MARTELIRVVFVLNTTRDPDNEDLQNVLDLIRHQLKTMTLPEGVEAEEE